MGGDELAYKLHPAQLLLSRATFHTSPLFYLRASILRTDVHREI